MRVRACLVHQATCDEQEELIKDLKMKLTQSIAAAADAEARAVVGGIAGEMTPLNTASKGEAHTQTEDDEGIEGSGMETAGNLRHKQTRTDRSILTEIQTQTEREEVCVCDERGGGRGRGREEEGQRDRETQTDRETEAKGTSDSAELHEAMVRLRDGTLRCLGVDVSLCRCLVCMVSAYVFGEDPEIKTRNPKPETQLLHADKDYTHLMLTMDPLTNHHRSCLFALRVTSANQTRAAAATYLQQWRHVTKQRGTLVSRNAPKYLSVTPHMQQWQPVSNPRYTSFAVDGGGGRGEGGRGRVGRSTSVDDSQILTPRTELTNARASPWRSDSEPTAATAAAGEGTPELPTCVAMFVASGLKHVWMGEDLRQGGAGGSPTAATPTAATARAHTATSLDLEPVDTRGGYFGCWMSCSENLSR